MNGAYRRTSKQSGRSRNTVEFGRNPAKWPAANSKTASEKKSMVDRRWLIGRCLYIEIGDPTVRRPLWVPISIDTAGPRMVQILD